MDGNELRNAAIRGNFDFLKDCIVQKCNTCSSDEFGLTSLHYAVWNRHTECVKLLVSNSIGVDKYGTRCSSINLQSTLGYTALHIACLESTKDIVTLLLLAGSDDSIACNEGFLPRQLAARENPEVESSFDDFQKYLSGNKVIEKSYENLKVSLKNKYTFHQKLDNIGQLRELESHFPLPEFLFSVKDERVGALPTELAIHEHQIQPLMREGFDHMKGLDSLHCLQFTSEQAKLNALRRKQLVSQQNAVKAETDKGKVH